MNTYRDRKNRTYQIEQDPSTGYVIATRPGRKHPVVRRFHNTGDAMRWIRFLVPGGIELDDKH